MCREYGVLKWRERKDATAYRESGYRQMKEHRAIVLERAGEISAYILKKLKQKETFDENWTKQDLGKTAVALWRACESKSQQTAQDSF